jgi:phage-related protein
VQYFTDTYNDVTEKVSQLWTDVVQFFTDTYNDVTEKVSELWTDVTQFFTDTYNDVTEKVSQLWTDVVQFFTDLYNDVTGKVDELWNDVVTAVEGGVEDFKLAVDGLIQDVVNFFKETDWMQVGKDVVQGIANGITSATNIIWEAVKDLGGSLLDAIKTFLKIGSPSKIAAEEIGRPFAEGIAQGITGGIGRINQAVVRAMSGTISPVISGSATQTGTRIIENNNTRQYNLSVVTNQSPSVVIQSFEVMEAVSI